MIKIFKSALGGSIKSTFYHLSISVRDLLTKVKSQVDHLWERQGAKFFTWPKQEIRHLMNSSRFQNYIQDGQHLIDTIIVSDHLNQIEKKFGKSK